ncbi:PAS domain-containing sensor histidine kinase [Polynucleobacter sp. Ross1-W9]|uniref:PAS domain-containing sensor histidine kinase n=1 Tax=Polynucleobacter parvulilacunae TaxID=1855631 RepID=UPI001C0B4AE2|nr:PAS domain-containing sensor histidine kinase [Polynucleobacter parvulilacunae]MBU3556209.1 PAS domain-containing sensor histidine kinase [Polynucleobacter parvulilacunae]
MNYEFNSSLIHSNELLKRLANTVPCGLYEYTRTADEIGNYHFLNSKALEIFEITENEIPIFANLILKMFSEDDIDRIRKLDQEVHRTQSPFFFEGKIKTRSNAIKWVRFSSQPSNSYLNGSLIWSGYILDITTEKDLSTKTINQEIELSIASIKLSKLEKIESLNRQLEILLEEKSLLLKSTAAYAKANKLGTVISSVAHEINSPLGAISINSESLGIEIASIENHGITAENITNLKDIAYGLMKATRRATKIIVNLRGLFVAGEVGYENFNLSDTLKEVFELMNREITSVNIDLKKFINPNIHFYGDKGQIQMVLLNAINNAIDALREYDGPRIIEVSLIEGDERIQLDVKDSGYGFKPGFLKKAFDLFQTTKTKGMGIGLWLSRSIIENHNGSINASNNETGGATLCIQLRKSNSSAKATTQVD